MYVGGEKPDMGGSSDGHGYGSNQRTYPRGMVLGSLNTDGTASVESEKDRHPSLGSEGDHEFVTPVVLASQDERQESTDMSTPRMNQNPFSTVPNTPNAPNEQGNGSSPGSGVEGGHSRDSPPRVSASYLDFDRSPIFENVLDDDGPASRRASELPMGASGIGGAGFDDAVAAGTPRSRSMSHPSEGTASPLRHSNSGAGGMNRSGSKRRKPVPSLGPELRGQIREEQQQQQHAHRRPSEGMPPLPTSNSSSSSIGAEGQRESGGVNGAGKKSYQIMPDPPMNLDR